MNQQKVPPLFEKRFFSFTFLNVQRNEMSKKAEYDQRIRELWILQLRLNKYVGETETRLDPAIQEVLTNQKIPDWFNSGIVFSPLVLAMDDEVMNIENEIVDSQDALKDLYTKYQEQLNETKKLKGNEIIELNDEIDKLNTEIYEIQSRKLFENNEKNIINQHEMYYDTEINRLKEEASDLQQENQECADTIQAYMDEIEIYTNQIIEQCEDHKKNQILTKKMKLQINEMLLVKQAAQKSSNILAKRTANLQSAVDKLIGMKQDNDNQLRDLIKDDENNRIIETQYQKIQEAIKASQEKQEEILDEMLKSIELSEESAAEVQLYQYEVNTFEKEKDRIEKLISSVDNNLNEMVSDFDKNCRKFYDIIFGQIDYRMDSLKNESITLQREKDVVEHQIEIANQKCAKLKPNVISMEFTSANSAEYVLLLKEKVEALFAEREILLKRNADTKNRINQNREKLLNSGYKKRRTISKLRQKRQKNEVDICQLRGNLKSLLQKNGVMAEDNEKIRCYIEKIRKSSGYSLSHLLQEKEETINQIQEKINNELKENESEVQIIEQEISKYQLMAEQYSNDKHQNEKDFIQNNHENNAKLKNSKQQVKTLKDTIKRNYDELLKGQALLNEAQLQVNFLREKAQPLIKKERYIKSQMERSKLEQVALLSEIDRYREIENKLDMEIELQKQKMNDIVAPNHFSDSDRGPDPL
ncbi:hypothetical protein TRFO_08830 [Tritrichomonas foetus]|uniref:Uncharacterized protein n=1 Tax=Tritrichomonas foetus TaxID=1144522 RepID=A0A1J4JIY7_9EUKA|nr:hypothetical protein TRFO_08830 [Tritrichomonas foetus]|eukprot:OHS98553.1 hypothetical protein TRFO_08830 [Tritrichomonas foetus]